MCGAQDRFPPHCPKPLRHQRKRYSEPETTCGPSLAPRFDMAGRVRVLHLGFVLVAWGPPAALAQPPVGVVSGTVSIAAPDGQANLIPGVTLTLACPNAQPRTEMSDDQGRFRFDDVPADTCSIVAELQGLTSMTKAVVVKSGKTTDLGLR